MVTFGLWVCKALTMWPPLSLLGLGCDPFFIHKLQVLTVGICSNIPHVELAHSLWLLDLTYCFHVQNSQVICFQINLHVGSVMNIPCCVIVFWYLPLPLSKLWQYLSDSHLLASFLFLFLISRLSESPNVFLWTWNFWLLLLPHLFWNSIPFILLILVQKVLFLDEDESQI